MSKHTPGPWFIWSALAMQREGMEPDEIADELLFEGEFQIYAGDPVECTRGSLRGHSAHICDIDADNFDFDDDEETHKATALANARLIAAAPDLLEALKGMVQLDEEEHQRGPGDIDICKEVQDAYAAIAKAEGQR